MLKQTIFKSKLPKIAGRSYIDVERAARKIHKAYASATKRNTYVRSVYFNKEKVFIDLFWTHLHQKSRADRKRRLKYYAAAIDLIEHTTCEPITKKNPNGKNETVYRFSGVTAGGEPFYVQIKQDNPTKNKYFISTFPPKQR